MGRNKDLRDDRQMTGIYEQFFAPHISLRVAVHHRSFGNGNTQYPFFSRNREARALKRTHEHARKHPTHAVGILFQLKPRVTRARDVAGPVVADVSATSIPLVLCAFVDICHDSELIS